MKLCVRCKEEKPETEFPKNKLKKDNLDIYCRLCHSTAARIRRQTFKSREVVNIPATKFCGQCKTTKSNEYFHRNRSSQDGLVLYCKECLAKSSRTKASKEKAIDPLHESLVWKPIPEMNGLYSATSCGKIRSEKRMTYRANGRPHTTQRSILALSKDTKGYLQFRPYLSNKPRSNAMVHRAVYSAFKGPIPTGYDIDHMDGDPLNNKVKNLQAVDRKSHANITLDRIRKQSFEDGRKIGVDEGHKTGFDSGYKKGYDQGFHDCETRNDP